MPAPTISSISPDIGSVLGGASVTLTGADFTGTTGVTIGGVAATSVVVVSATSITCVTPAGSRGVASVVVTNGSGSNGANSLYQYIANVPKDTYIYLKGGRGDGFVPLWTGQFSDAVVDEKSEPYRDIFPGSSDIKYAALGVGSFLTFGASQTALIYEDPITLPTTPGSLSATPKASTSDEVSHTLPRQFVKMVSWRSYLSISGLWYHFRLADILGVGSLSRDN